MTCESNRRRSILALLAAFVLLAAPRLAAVASAQDGHQAPPGEAAAPAPDPSSSADGWAGDEDEELDQEEELVDFETEESESEQDVARMLGAAGKALGSVGGGPQGFKLFVDMLLDYGVGEEKFEFRPNHVIAILQMTVLDNYLFAMHLSDDPVFFELNWTLSSRLTLKVGKLFIPFGTNEFHHIIGGRVDELSHFLPETWSDYGLGLSYVLIDTDWLSADYDLYMVNGFQGDDRPLVSAGFTSDNNMGKGLGARLKLIFFNNFVVTGSLYHDVWDAEDRYNLLFYALGLELRPGAIPLPVLDKLRLRGEWSRGEFRLPARNYQQGILRHAYARAGFYGEAQYPLMRALSVRLRAGQLNPDNTVTDDGDLYIAEPAVIVGSPKLMVLLAYQATIPVGRPYAPDEPADIIYAKFFLRY